MQRLVDAVSPICGFGEVSFGRALALVELPIAY
jgi:hypothetical protein